MDKITSKEAAKILSDIRNSLKTERGGIYDKMTQHQQRDEDALDMAIDVLLDGWNAAAHYNEGHYDTVNSNCWVRTVDRRPTKDDGQNCQVLTASKVSAFGKDWVIYELPWVGAVANGQREYTYWMPLPKLPEVEG